MASIYPGRFILTTAPGDEQIAFNETRAVDETAAFVMRLGGGEVLAESQSGFRGISGGFKKSPPVFIRHIAPADIEAVKPFEVAEAVIGGLDKTRVFSVQARASNEAEARAFQSELAGLLVNRGYELDVKNPHQIISAYLKNGRVLAGASCDGDNLSDWAGGRIRFKKDDKMISRAEFKLLEAAHVFKLSFKAGGRALDLGAAPGGWSRVLAGYGMSVAAVDPAPLDSSLSAVDSIRHYKTTAGDFIKNHLEERFDIIVNDMRMDARLSAEVLISAKTLLNDGGFCVMTLKLAEKNKQKSCARALAALTGHYEATGARQLFHNRSEVTAVLTPAVNKRPRA